MQTNLPCVCATADSRAWCDALCFGFHMLCVQVGSAGRVRAANRIGAATVLCRKGLTAESLLTGLQVYAAKAEDDRGF